MYRCYQPFCLLHLTKKCIYLWFVNQLDWTQVQYLRSISTYVTIQRLDFEKTWVQRVVEACIRTKYRMTSTLFLFFSYRKKYRILIENSIFRHLSSKTSVDFVLVVWMNEWIYFGFLSRIYIRKIWAVLKLQLVMLSIHTVYILCVQNFEEILVLWVLCSRSIWTITRLIYLCI